MRLILFVYFAIIFFQIAAVWIMYNKADMPGWACLVPIYNFYILMKIAGRPGWWLLLLFIPLVDIVVYIIINLDIANNFGKGLAFGIGLIFLPVIFIPILAFGDARYGYGKWERPD